MAVHAHPDDESSKGAATLAGYAARGVDVLVVTCTGGERGDVLNPALDRPEVRADLPGIRRREMAAAAGILGVGHRFLGYRDSGLPGPGKELPPDCFARVPVAEAAARLREVVQEFRPHVVVTYDPSGGYPHPDHIRTHEVAVAAFDDPGGPWEPLKLYYQVAFSKRWFETLHAAMTSRGIESGMGEVLDGWPDWAPELPVTTRVECADWFDVRDRAFRAHATQADPANPFFAHPRDLEREVWPTEDYSLARVRPAVTAPADGRVEDDLFAGIPADASAG
ncbi:mycothiol conjugate amidase Mca [Streptantibioticus cattleyicolor]|nr:mycothiol conjugate amidase Mca [Streptomyces sp. SID5468]MYS59366.1 mycothiol conjugate amidase Mca [Streptomyces sp. SID5468]CCB75092.1 putative N-acetylglucosaminylphosphatidylinositol deacetylase [Streptantibioticus cattleyicolor NRRL 8057 = DSM 46488]